MATVDANDLAQPPTISPAPPPVRTGVVEIVIPVYNEQAILATSVLQLHDYLRARFPFEWRITIVDNASIDETSAVAADLARTLPRVQARFLPRKGRGLALRSAWLASDADVLAYMDVDLSTDLDALLPLVAPLLSGHSDLAIGSRFAAGASVARYPTREFVSRCYNLILRAAFATQILDAQCGFKALRREVVSPLLAAVEDDGWFFDTELLLIAERNGLRIHQVPIDWTDDPDSRVNVRQTAIDDLRGVLRLLRRFATGRGRIDLGGAARVARNDDLGRELVNFATIGVVSTIASLALFLLTRANLGAILANAFAVSATFVANTWANARFTQRRARPAWRAALATYVGALALTSSALASVHAFGGGPLAEIAVLAATWPIATLARLVATSRSVRRTPTGNTR